MKKYLIAVAVFVAMFTALSVLNRELWFDEALTLLNFVLPLELDRIYFSYFIPNNHIVYSMMLKLWDNIYCGGMDTVPYWRLLSVLCAVIMVWLIAALRFRMDNGKVYPAILVLSAMSISAVFINYATALRGYAASWLFAATAMYALYDIFHDRKRTGWILYAVSCLLAVGTVPTNLLMLTASAIYALPWMQKAFWRDKRFYAVFAMPPVSLLIFYAPIAENFLATLKLGEGFSSRSGAALITVGMYIACFGLLLLFSFFTLKKRSAQEYYRYLIWLLPFAAIFILHRAPFPRVFVTLLPVLAMLIIDNIKDLIHDNWKTFHRAVFFLTVMLSQIILTVGGAVIAARSKLSSYEDDFFQPWYMYPDYRISATAADLHDLPSGSKIFLSFSADPMPLLFYAAQAGIKHEYLCDVPFGKIKHLPVDTFAVLRKDEDPTDCEKRFSQKLRLYKTTPQHNIFEVILPQVTDN